MASTVLASRTRSRAAWLAVGLSAVAALAGVVLVPVPARAAGTLGTQAAAAGRYFGTAVPAGKLGNAAYVAILDREFTMITPENEMKWDTVEASRGNFNFGPGDRIVAHAQAHGQRMRGHTTVWHSQLPAWVSAITDAATLKTVMDNHITTEMTHFKGKIYAWDVVNEAFADGSTQHRSSVFQNVLGNGFIEEAFRTARSADPGAKLCYNDYNIEDWNAAKTQGVYSMVKDFKARGVPIDCVGFQSHFGSGGPPSNFPTTLSSFAALGVDVQLTELDIAQASGAAYSATVKACVNVSRCAGITVWGVRDSDSWRGGEAPLLFDANGTAKDAYQAVLTAFGGAVPVAKPSPPAQPSRSGSPSASASVSASASASASQRASGSASVPAALAASIAVAGQDATVSGTVAGPDPGGHPLAWLVLGAVVLAAAVTAGLMLVRRRRRSAPGYAYTGAPGTDAPDRPAARRDTRPAPAGPHRDRTDRAYSDWGGRDTRAYPLRPPPSRRAPYDRPPHHGS